LIPWGRNAKRTSYACREVKIKCLCAYFLVLELQAFSPPGDTLEKPGQAMENDKAGTFGASGDGKYTTITDPSQVAHPTHDYECAMLVSF
jgi:hypothetical protein